MIKDQVAKIIRSIIDSAHNPTISDDSKRNQTSFQRTQLAKLLPALRDEMGEVEADAFVLDEMERSAARYK